MRAARTVLATILLVCMSAIQGLAQDPARTVVTTQNSDYFGFDLRTEQNVTLDQCSQVCLGDQQCRAFTYNTRAQWCFLKSDYALMQPFEGAVAGKVVAVSGDPDIGAPAELTFLPDWLQNEVRLTRAALTSNAGAVGETGLAALVAGAQQALIQNDPRTAMNNLMAAAVISPDDGTIWVALARAILATPPANYDETVLFQRNAVAGAWTGYQLSRTAAARADSLQVLAQGLDRRDLYRPAISAYQASLSLVPSPAVQAELDDLRARKGFRIVEHTVDSDNSSPRVCAVFSEDLVKTGVDYAPFVTVDDQAPASVSAEGRQICVGGLAHGKHYRIVFRPGLPAAIGEVIESPVALSIYVRDRAPSARFTGDSFVLPSTARRGIPVVTVNMSAAKMALYRIGDRSLAQLLSGYQFLRQIDGYDISTIRDQMGEPVWEGELEIASELNKEVTTSFPVDEALPERKPGVYVLTAVPVDDRRDSWDSRATQWFVVSDIGLSTYTGQDGLNVFARSLATAKPIAGTELTLLARNNEILGTATTDAEGRATFQPGLTRGEGGMVPAVLMAAQGDEDFVFLDMQRAGFDLSDRGVEGRAAPGALDVYAWTERGIYRAGETVYASALARDDAAAAVENLPLTFIFRRPDGVEDRRIVSDGRFAGGHAVDLDLAANAQRGTWTLSIHTDPEEPAVATRQFLVEDFVPDRIEFDLAASKSEIAVGEEADVTVDGRFLYGAPAAGLELEGELTVSTMRAWNRFIGYSFGLSDEQAGEAMRVPLSGLPVVGEDGKATFPISVDNVPATTRLLNAKVSVRMREAGGRAVERSIDLAVKPQGEMIGIKPEFADESVPQGGTARFKVIAVDSDGNRKSAGGLLWSLVRIERNYQWYRSGSYWNYEPIVTTREIGNGTIDLAADSEGEISVPVDWGRYRLQVETADPTGPATSYEFEAGWYVEATSTETPDGLEIALDKETYQPGEIARLQVTPRFAGELLVTVGAESLLATVTATVPEGGATIDVPVGADWGAGAYITATLYRPGEQIESRMPARAIGVKWLKVDPGAKQLAVSLDPVEKMTPRAPLTIPVTVGGLPANAQAYVMVAAVDVGILNLTNYQAPDPEGWYFGQRMMGMELRDLYGRLIDGSLGATGRLRTGGDGAQLTSQGNAPTERLVAFFTGPVTLDANGQATVSFDIPQFNGTVRVMAVAWTKEAVGHAVKDVIVRDPVVLTASLPRFLAPGDAAQMRLDIANTDGPAGDYAVTVETTGDLSTGSAALPDKVTLAAGARQYLTIPLVAQTAGEAGLTIRLAHADGLTVEQTLALPVRPAAIPVTTRTVVNLAANGGSLRVDRELLAASLLDGAYVSVGVSPVSAFDVPSLLMTLDRYPYGCAEQTTSRALPLLYVSELATQAGMPEDVALRERIQGAIYRVLNYQSSSGSFGLWSPGYGDLWLDAYVTDFLTRARELNYDVPSQAMQQAVANLQNSMAYDVDLSSRSSEIAYALYVLARNKKASIGDLRYYADTQIEQFASPMSRAQLAASLALYGDAQRAEAAFSSALELARSNTETNYYRSDYGSALRDGAAMLALAAETRPVPASINSMIDVVAAERKKVTWTSTQDEAWMLLAARAIKAGSDALALNVNGVAHGGAYSERVTGLELMDNPITIQNLGPNPVEAVVTAVAAPAEPLPAGGNGFTINRTYYTLDGNVANVTEATQNERYVVVLTVNELSDWPSRVLITDLLPAGFQIDNPRIVSSADLGNFTFLPQTEAAALEFRDDRFVAAFDRQPGSDRSVTVAYVVRAVTPGVYAHPAARVEDMYRPEFFANTAAGMMEVQAP
ncbi:MAG: alpha-2-macroglobulin family protein [Rhizobiaceae bacterium]|nr:alpha-2-macroglobulin family protein [Rhizobiaceae bacterium]